MSRDRIESISWDLTLRSEIWGHPAESGLRKAADE
jgi:hypothetical protein